MRSWLWILSFLLVSGCYEKTTCCIRDGGCPDDIAEDSDVQDVEESGESEE